ncbi:MAG: sigma 54-interacting transcriptional regulator, partial [Balneolales bacterium]
DILGYSPQDYVLASETETLVRYELEALVEDVAHLSHQRGKSDDKEVFLSDRRGETIKMVYNFELFKVKSSTANFLSISFKNPQRSSDNKSEIEPLFVAGSPAMKSVMAQVDSLIPSESHVLVRGEASTGKKRIARMIVRPAVLGGADLVEIDAKTQPVSSIKEMIKKSQIKLVFIIANIDQLSIVEQRLLKQLLDDKNLIRVIATSCKALEILVEQDQFDADLYYLLSFHPLLLPPLRQRKDDIPEIAETWIRNASKILFVSEIQLLGSEIEKLINHSWSGNFEELFNVLRKYILSGNGKIIVNNQPETNEHELDTEPEVLTKIITYDEMNRRYLTSVLKETKNKIYGKDGAASLLGLKPTTLQSKLKKLGIR